jgi:hypothetical protein
VRERPILFSAPMIRAVRADRKTQTRRIVKGAALDWLDKGLAPGFVADPSNSHSPYGYAGDRLWCRENVRAVECKDGWDSVLYLADNECREIENSTQGAERWLDLAHYDYERRGRCAAVPSIHMPRWACREVLGVAGVRIERLSEISEADALAEGIVEYEPTDEDPAEYAWDDERGRGAIYESARAAYEYLWRHINGPRSWDANPWVWVVVFERVQA